MRRNLWMVPFVLLWSLAALAGEVTLTPQHGILLLNNGHLIEGTITAAGDRYDVVQEDQETRVKRSDVAVVCRNAQECYLHKRRLIEQDRAQDHLELAEWCLRIGLLESAEREIDDAKAIDATHPKILLVQRRAKLARENPIVAEPVVGGDKILSGEHLDRMARNLPPGSMQMYTDTIQPLLLNSCTKGGCHSPQSKSELRLERISISKTSGRRPTQRNLQAVLAMVDRARPEESKLLQAPIRPHGAGNVPIFTDREQSQYKQLVQWVYLVANAKVVAPPPTLEERGAPLLQTMPHTSEPAAEESPQAVPQQAKSNKMSPVGWSDSFPGQSAPSVANPASAEPQYRATRVHGQVVLRPLPKRAEPTKEFKPSDPFDPEPFNRRFFGSSEE